MILRRSSKVEEPEVVEPQGFDAYELRLGDMMRGERATMGKSLLDVQRELRIKAAYIAAIENADPEAFDTPGFIAGYVRSYARYLNMDPDRAFAAFCAESGFEVAHGMSAEASVVRKQTGFGATKPRHEPRDMFAAPKTPFIPEGDGLLSRIEPSAVGSVLVLVGLISAITFGGWTVLQEVQRVQVAPVEQTPVVLSDLDPLAGAQTQAEADTGPVAPVAPSFDDTSNVDANRAAALDRLYRPQALDVPVLVARDAPISTLDPRETGAFAGAPVGTRSPEVTLIAEAPNVSETPISPVPQVVEDLGPTIRMVAAYPSWVRVRSAQGNTLFEGIMEPGDTYDIPDLEAAPTLRTGESGAIYFAMGSDCYGPVGSRGEVTSNLALERLALADKYEAVDPTDQGDAFNIMVADLRATGLATLPQLLPCRSN